MMGVEMVFDTSKTTPPHAVTRVFMSRASSDVDANIARVFGARARALIDAVRAHGGGFDGRIGRDDDDSEDDDDSALWTLDTRYYLARVHAIDSSSGDDVARALGCARAVVFACGNEEEFDDARRAAARTGDEDADTRVVVWDLARDGAGRRVRVPASVAAWALDRGYEVVETRLDDAEADAALRRGDDGDGRGVRRVIETLEATAWKSMELKELGRESDLGRRMVGTPGRDAAADVEALAAAHGLLGDEDAPSPLASEELHARISALYDEHLALKKEDRLERLVEMLGDAVLDDE